MTMLKSAHVELRLSIARVHERPASGWLRLLLGKLLGEEVRSVAEQGARVSAYPNLDTVTECSHSWNESSKSALVLD